MYVCMYVYMIVLYDCIVCMYVCMYVSADVYHSYADHVEMCTYMCIFLNPTH